VPDEEAVLVTQTRDRGVLEEIEPKEGDLLALLPET
jgi:hypothetical protein